MSGDLSVSVAIYDPAPGDMRLRHDDRPGQTAIYFYVHSDVWFCLHRAAHTGIAGEAAAMRRLAELATEAAAELEQRAATQAECLHAPGCADPDCAGCAP